MRLISIFAILLIISFLTFTLMYLAPGDLIKNLLGNRPSSPEAEASIRAQYHLNDPFFVRYFDWLTSAFQGDFGTSIRLQQPVSEVLMSRLGVTSLLIISSFIIAVLFAIPLGIVSATRAGSRSDQVISSFSLFGLSAPSFALGIFAITVFSLWIPLFPAYGAGDPGIDRFWHLLLPSFVLAAGIGGILMRMCRTAVLRELESDAVTFARGRGLNETRVKIIALRGALIPIVTSAGLILTFIIGGTIIVENVFALPGLGKLLEEAVTFKDLPVVQGVTLVVAAAIGIVTIVVDLSYRFLDPRVRAQEVK